MIRKPTARDVSLPSMLLFACVILAGQDGCSGAPAENANGDLEALGNPGGAPILSGLTGKCLDDQADHTTNGNKIQLYACNGTDAQSWTYKNRTLMGPGGKCLDIRSDQQVRGNVVQLYQCNGTTAQEWSIQGTAIKSTAGLCLDVTGGVNANGTQIDLAACNGSLGQVWHAGSAPPPPADAGAPNPRSGKIKFHPGHYVLLDPHASNTDFALMDSLKNDPNVEGFELFVNWSDLEGAKGDYSSGKALIQSYLDKLNSYTPRKHLFLGVVERHFGCIVGQACSYAGNPECDPTNAKYDDAKCKSEFVKAAQSGGGYPQYLKDASYGCSALVDGASVCGYVVPPYGQRGSGNLVSTARFWEQPVMDRLIALSQAYGSYFDGNPAFENIALGETAVGNPQFNGDGYAVQLKRWFSASRAAWPHTSLRLVANFWPGDAAFADVMEYAIGLGGVVVGGPDVVPGGPDVASSVAACATNPSAAGGCFESQANRIFAGHTTYLADQRAPRATSAPITPWVSEVQDDFGLGGLFPVPGGKASAFPQSPRNMWGFAHDYQRMSYMIWMYNTWDGKYRGDAHSEFLWNSCKGLPGDSSTCHGLLSELPEIDSVHGSVYSTACPTSYKSGCDGP